MTHQELIDDLRLVIITGLKLEGVNEEDITPHTILFGEGLGLDSLDAVELSVLLEKRYGVSFSDAENVRHAFASLDALATEVLRLQAPRGPLP